METFYTLNVYKNTFYSRVNFINYTIVTLQLQFLCVYCI